MLIWLARAFGIPLAPFSGMSLLRALGFRRWNWRTCWREGDFWLCMATLLLPFGFVLLLFRWEPLRDRIFSNR
jgi:hypothetical protein